MTQKHGKNQAKTPLHLRLTTNDWVECFKELTRAELGVLYFIRTRDPYGDRSLDIDCAELGKLLGLHRITISKSLEALKKKGLIDLEIEKARVQQKIRNRKPTLLTYLDSESNSEETKDNEMCAPTHNGVRPGTEACVQAQSCAPTHNGVRPGTEACVQAQSCAPTHNGVRPGTESTPEALSDKTSNTPHTIKTYSNFIKTLSDSERENFLEFGKKKAEQLPKAPELPLKWIEANWEELRSQWEKTDAGQTHAAAATDWTQHPDWPKWLDFMRSRGIPTFVAIGKEWLDRKTRRAIADWADERNLIWGAES